jgi:hypothetical protein
MAFRVGFLALAVVLGASAVGVVACSGPDQGVITFAERPSEARGDESDTETDEPPASSSPTDTGTATGSVNNVFVSDAFPAVNTACGSCHLAGTSGAPIFFGADAAATYPLFKARNYHLSNSLFVTKGAHLGPELTTEQRAAIDKWVAAESGAPDGG